MADIPTISIGEVKRDLSELINRVAYGKERFILTSRGRPKAALVSVEDIHWLESFQHNDVNLEEWLKDSEAIAEAIHKRRKGVPLDVDAAIRDSRDDLESRDASGH